jgi:hypothetical protein
MKSTSYGDMVMLEGKVLMIKIDDKVVSKFNKETIKHSVKEIESKTYDGILYQESIKYHLVQIRLDIKKNKNQAKVIAV